MADQFDPYSDWLGIEDARRPLTNYQLLGLATRESRTDIIEEGARKQLGKLAPFIKGEHALLAKRITIEIESAKTCLLNPEIKVAYDAALQSRGAPAADQQAARPARTKSGDAGKTQRPAASASGKRLSAAGSSSKRRAAQVAGRPSGAREPQKDFDPYHKWLGIPPQDQPPNYYRLLGISFLEPDLEVIANAADARMVQVNRFRSEENFGASNRILGEIASARLCLLTAAKKTEYDRMLQKLDIGTGYRIETDPAVSPRSPQQHDGGSDAGRTSLPSRPFARKRQVWEYWQAWVGVCLLLVITLGLVLFQSIGRDRSVAKSEATSHLPGATAPDRPKSVADVGATKPSAAEGRAGDGTPPVAPTGTPASNTPGASAQAVGGVLPPASAPAQPTAQKPSGPQPASESPRKETPSAPAAQNAGTGAAAWAAKARNVLDIALPSGKRLTDAMFDVPADWQRQLFPEEAILYTAKYPNGAVQGVFGMKTAKFDGAAASLYLNGRLQTLVFYRDGKRNGSLKQWNEDGTRLFYGEYKNGKKDGVFCFFREGLPVVIEEWRWQEPAKPRDQCLVKWTEGSPRAVLANQLSDGDSEEMSTALQQMAALEETMKNGEEDLRPRLAEWFRDYQEEMRKQTFLGQTDQRRDRQRARQQVSNARAALDKAAHQQLQRALVPH